jgi:F-type H+-transporting ATPase subunit delta
MSETTIAYRYAKPLMDLALEKGILEEVARDMELLKDACDSNYELQAVLKNPIIRGYKKLAILKALFGNLVNPLTLMLFDVIDTRNREEILYTLSTEFIRLYKEHKNIQQVTIVSAVELTDEIRTSIKTKLAKELNKEIELQEEINPNLIGGFILKIGNSLIDNSLLSGLKRLKRNFNQNQ